MGYNMVQCMVAAIESLQAVRILEFTSCLACNHMHWSGPKDLSVLLHNIHRYLMCSQEFAIATAVQGNLLSK